MTSSASRESKDSISILGIEEVVLGSHTSKCKVESVKSWMIVLSEMHEISDYKTRISRSFSVTLRENALVSFVALAVVCETVKICLRC